MEDAGDGPAFFVMTAVSFILVPLALAFMLIADAPSWVVFVIFGPLIIGASIGLLRPFKGVMFNQQWTQKAQEVRSKDFS